MSSGRKLEFDSELALDAAMHIFWQKGFTGASLSDLTQGMGINKPSMYRTFGNKETLFVKTTERYIHTKMKPHLQWLYQPSVTLKQRLKNHMMSIIEMQCDTKQAMGCYLVLCQSELVSGNIPSSAEHILNQAEAMPSVTYTELFNTDEEAIQLGLNQNAEANSLTLYTLLKGTASMARSGVSRAKLEYTVETVLTGMGL